MQIDAAAAADRARAGKAAGILSRFWEAMRVHLWATVKADLNRHELAWLLNPSGHISLLATRRIRIVVTRVRLFAGVFAVLTPLWIVLDVLTFEAEVWRLLLVARIVATLAFVFILLHFKRAERPADAYRALALLMTIPAVFFLVTHAHMARFDLGGMQQAFGQGYAFLPFVMIAGLSIFPLTLAESLIFAVPVAFVEFLAAAILWPNVDWAQSAGLMWLLLLIAAVSALSGLSQLAFMIALVRDAIRDRMTGCFARGSGEELLELQFMLSQRTQGPMTVAFIDVDRFKEVNDRYGHDAGDKVLIEVANQMRRHLRTGDALVRWGGEEFLILMPGATAAQACLALQRVRQGGLGLRPDGKPVTASIGVAERVADAPGAWKDLVERADARMYEAKQAGRDRIVGCG